MKFGIRTPSIKKSISARTTGAAKRAVKRAVISGYGKKGMGWVHNPQKAAYNAVYNKTTVSAATLMNSNGGSSGSTGGGGTSSSQGEGGGSKKHGCITAIVVVIIIALFGSCVSQCSRKSSGTSSAQVLSSTVSSEQVSSMQESSSSDLSSEVSSELEPSSVQESSAAPVSNEVVSSVAPAAAVPESATPAAGKKATGNADNFNTYNNTDQQNTKGYVLNTKTKKFHLPSCRDVPKISKSNYGTVATRDEAVAEGYKPCGHCNP